MHGKMRVLRGIKLVFILLIACSGVLFTHALSSSPVFEEGIAYELYCGTSSAEIVVTRTPALTKFLRPDVRGECVRYEGNRYLVLKEQFGAELLFTEEAAGVVNYYLYAEKLGQGVLINGKEVNLHIAVARGQTAAGTPLIFGGF